MMAKYFSPIWGDAVYREYFKESGKNLCYIKGTDFER
jgi:hypothetical protein